MNRTERAILEIIHHIQENSAPILDVGCGFGEALALLRHNRFTNLTGVDYLPHHVEIAKRLSPQIQLLVARAEKLPFPDNSFQAIMLLDVIEHVGNDHQAVTEAARVLKPSGLLIITVPHRGGTTFLDPANLLFKLTGRREYHRHYTAAEIIAMMGDQFTHHIVEKRGLGLSQIIHLLTYPIRKLLPEQKLMAKWVNQVEGFEYAKQTGQLGYHLFVSATKRRV